MLHAYDYDTGQGISVMTGPEGLELLGPAGMELLGPAGMELLGPYDIGLMADAPPTYKAGTDFTCTATNVCTGKNNVVTAAYRELQTALNRAAVQFPEAGRKAIEVDGTVGPDTLVLAWAIAKHLGPESDPLIKQVGETNIMDATSVKALATLLATNPIGVKDAFDKQTIAAAGEEKKETTKTKRRRWWIAGLALMAGVGAVAGVVTFARKKG